MIFMVLILLALLFARLLTHRLIAPIKKLPKRLEQPGFDPKKDGVYPELLPLLQELKERRRTSANPCGRSLPQMCPTN